MGELKTLPPHIYNRITIARSNQYGEPRMITVKLRQDLLYCITFIEHPDSYDNDWSVILDSSKELPLTRGQFYEIYQWLTYVDDGEVLTAFGKVSDSNISDTFPLAEFLSTYRYLLFLLLAMVASLFF